MSEFHPLHITEEALQDLIDGLRMIRTLTGGGALQVRRTPNRLSLYVDPAAPNRAMSSDQPQIYRVETIEIQHLTARLWTGQNTLGDPVKIAKPRMLQHRLHHYPQLTGLSTIDAQTIDVYTAAAQGRWIITPAYAVGDLILAAAYATTLSLPADVPLVDLNADARAWCQLPDDLLPGPGDDA